VNRGHSIGVFAPHEQCDDRQGPDEFQAQYLFSWFLASC
jgi:hypothetical protein